MKYELSKIFQKKKKQIIDLWMQNQLSDESLREDLMSNEDLRIQSEELVSTIVKNLGDDSLTNTESEAFNNVYEILAGISISRAKLGYSTREVSNYILSLKDAMVNILRQEIKSDPEQLVDLILKVSSTLDEFSMITTETFLKGREEVILRQTSEIAEISTPVIQLWDGILGLPIIGTLDSARTQVVMENLLQKIVETGSTITILDISGVPAVDSLVAQHLIKTVSATRLMGAECIISGIRPEIAQTIVHLGIDLSQIITKATLANALKYAFTMLQLEVRKKQTDKQTSFIK